LPLARPRACVAENGSGRRLCSSARRRPMRLRGGEGLASCSRYRPGSGQGSWPSQMVELVVIELLERLVR